jgi:hypothetical protein
MRKVLLEVRMALADNREEVAIADHESDPYVAPMVGRALLFWFAGWLDSLSQLPSVFFAGRNRSELPGWPVRLAATRADR